MQNETKLISTLHSTPSKTAKETTHKMSKVTGIGNCNVTTEFQIEILFVTENLNDDALLSNTAPTPCFLTNIVYILANFHHVSHATFVLIL